MPDRESIIRALTTALEPLPFVYALWLEGADATGRVDEYSDIDIWADVEDEREDEAAAAWEAALQSLSSFDYREETKHGHPKLRQRVYHLEGCGEYLMLDFNWQLHSRDPAESVLVEGSLIEPAKILFDKAAVIRFRPYNAADYEDGNRERLRECRYRATQHSRVWKYIRRGLYLEAYAYYNRYVFEPLIDLLRLIYTPANADYYLVHISHHIPAAQRERLEHFARVASLEDMAARMKPAGAWFCELETLYTAGGGIL